MSGYSDARLRAVRVTTAKDWVIRAAIDVVDSLRAGPPAWVAIADLEAAVDALRSLDADRGLRGARTPGEQEPD